MQSAHHVTMIERAIILRQCFDWADVSVGATRMKFICLAFLTFIITLFLLGAPGEASASKGNKKYSLTIILPGFFLHDLEVYPKWKVRKLKRKIASLAGASVKELTLMHEGNTLDDTMRLVNYGNPDTLEVYTAQVLEARPNMPVIPSFDFDFKGDSYGSGNDGGSEANDSNH